MNKYFSVDDKIFDIVQKNSGVKDFLISNGFEQFSNSDIFEKMSKNVSLAMALKMKKMNVELFEEKLVSFLDSRNSRVDINLFKKNEGNFDINVEGVLPCPIRIPLLEKFEEWLNENKENYNYTIGHDLKSANLGLDSIIEKVKTGDENKLPDVLMSAGFDLFFDKKLMGQFLDNDVFEVSNDEMNSDFCNDKIDLRDPDKKYLITGVVPAVFLVNKNELKGRKIPKTWDDILSEEFEDSVAVPMGDLDLFNALVVNLYKDYGMDGIKRLARSYMKNLHPAQMVKAKGKNNSNNPAISIIPYFFTQMIQGDEQIAVWPEDGAIISPIFMVAKKSSREMSQPIIDFFNSEEVGRVFSANGKFPSTNKMIDNGLSEDQNFKWVGWDFIRSNDIGALIEEIEKVFNESIAN